MNHSSLHKRVLWITQTAVMLALLIAVQAATSGLGNQFVTGSCVNLILAVTALTVGLWGGVAVAVISPFGAFLFGIGPKFIQLIPAIALGNLVYVVLLALMVGKTVRPMWRQGIGLVTAAVSKFLTLYFVITRLLVPALVSAGVIPAKASAVLAANFSWPQLVTATIGGILALVVTPALKKVLDKTK